MITLRLLYGMSRPSVVFRLYSVVLLRSAERVEILGNIFAPSNSLGTWAICIKILEKIPRVIAYYTRMYHQVHLLSRILSAIAEFLVIDRHRVLGVPTSPVSK